MKTSKLVGIGALLLYTSITEAADGVGSHGGDAVVCYNQSIDSTGQPVKNGVPLQIISVDLLDHWEWSQSSNYKLNFPAGTTYMESVSKILQRIKQIDPILFRLFEKIYLNFPKNYAFVDRGMIPEINDSFTSVAVKSNCFIRQIARQKNYTKAGEAKYQIDKQLFSLLNINAQAGLVLHEIFYALALEFGATNSDGIRYFNFLVSSSFFDPSNVSLMKAVFVESFPKKPNHINLYDTGLGKYELELSNIRSNPNSHAAKALVRAGVELSKIETVKYRYNEHSPQSLISPLGLDYTYFEKKDDSVLIRLQPSKDKYLIGGFVFKSVNPKPGYVSLIYQDNDFILNAFEGIEGEFEFQSDFGISKLNYCTWSTVGFKYVNNVRTLTDIRNNGCVFTHNLTNQYDLRARGFNANAFWPPGGELGIFQGIQPSSKLWIYDQSGSELLSEVTFNNNSNSECNLIFNNQASSKNSFRELNNCSFTVKNLASGKTVKIENRPKFTLEDLIKMNGEL